MQQIVVVGRGESSYVNHLIRKFDGVAEDLPRSIGHPFRRARITIAYQNPQQLASVRSNANFYLEGVSVTLEEIS